MSGTAMHDGRWLAIARLLQIGLLAALLGGCAGAPVAPRTLAKISPTMSTKEPTRPRVRGRMKTSLPDG